MIPKKLKSKLITQPYILPYYQLDTMAFQSSDALKQIQKVCADHLLESWEKTEQELTHQALTGIKNVIDALNDKQYQQECRERLNKLIQKKAKPNTIYQQYCELLGDYDKNYDGFQRKITEQIFEEMRNKPLSQEMINNMGKVIQSLENQQYRKECHLRFQKIVTEQLLKSYESFQGPIPQEMRVTMETCLDNLSDTTYKNECVARFNKLVQKQEPCKFLHPMFTLQTPPQQKETVKKPNPDIYNQCFMDSVDDGLYDDMFEGLMCESFQSQKIEIHFVDGLNDADMCEFNVTMPLAQTLSQGPQQMPQPEPKRQQGLPQQMQQPEPKKQQGLQQQMPRQQESKQQGLQQTPTGKHTTTKPQLIGYMANCIIVLPYNTKYQKVKLLPTYQATDFVTTGTSIVTLVEGEYLLLSENTTYHVLEC